MASAESVVFAQLDRLSADGYRFVALSEERGEIDYGDPSVRVIIDPIDGSLNAKRGLPHHALSIAVAAGDTMADVVFGFVHDFGPQEEWWARRGGGAHLNGTRLDPTIGERRSRDGRLEVLGIESADPRWVAASIDSLQTTAYRLRALGTIASSLCQVAAARFDGMCRSSRPRDRLGGRTADRPRGGWPRQLPRPRGTPRRAPQRRTDLARVRRAHRGDARAARGDHRMIDWIIAERIAAFVAGTGDAQAPDADLPKLAAEAEKRVVAYTGLTPARPIPPPEGISRREWVASNIASMRLLLDPVLARANTGLGPLKPAIQIGVGFVLSTEVGVVVGYLGQRVLGQYELCCSTRRSKTARRGCCSSSRTSVRRSTPSALTRTSS